MVIDYVMIGKRIKKSRMKSKLTQESVAEASGITTVYLSKIENGKVTPTLETLGAICSVLCEDIGYIISGTLYNQKAYGNDVVLQLFQACSPVVKPVALHILKELSTLKTEGD